MNVVKYILVFLGLFSLSACQKELVFEIAQASEVTRYSDKTQQESVACDIGIYAINEMDFGVIIAPELTIFTENEQYTLKIKSWGDDWDYLIGADGEEASRQGLCFKSIDEESFSCNEVLSALRNEQYELTLNQCDKLDQSQLNCEVDVELADDGILLKKNNKSIRI